MTRVWGVSDPNPGAATNGESGGGAGVMAGNQEDGPAGDETEVVRGGGLDNPAGVQGQGLGWRCNGGVVRSRRLDEIPDLYHLRSVTTDLLGPVQRFHANSIMQFPLVCLASLSPRF